MLNSARLFSFFLCGPLVITKMVWLPCEIVTLIIAYYDPLFEERAWWVENRRENPVPSLSDFRPFVLGYDRRFLKMCSTCYTPLMWTMRWSATTIANWSTEDRRMHALDYIIDDPLRSNCKCVVKRDMFFAVTTLNSLITTGLMNNT